MPENLIYMDAPLGRTYGYKGVTFTSRRVFLVSEEDAVYLTAVLKGDGRPLFVRGNPRDPALDDKGEPLPPVDAMALQEEVKRNEEEEARNATDMAGEAEEPTDIQQEDEEAPKRRPRRKKQD